MSDASSPTAPVPNAVTLPVAVSITGGTEEIFNPAGYLLLESGDKLILEDGSGNLLLEG
jgi:hypothetical protein